VLLDEIEKAHRDLQHLFLQLLDDGRLTDSRGRTVDFRNVIVIMTSNLGDGTDPASVIRAYFPSEFVNRLDAVIAFEALSRTELEQIAAAEIAEVVQRAVRRGVTLTVTDAARELVVTSGYAPEDGVRPLGRVVRHELLAPVSHAIVADAAQTDGSVIIDAEGHSFVLRLEATASQNHS
jgi:ATP-dependent Clp protease ATP-binding subunit ClpB